MKILKSFILLITGCIAIANAQSTFQDFEKGVDLSAKSYITGVLLNQLIDNATVRTNRGLIIATNSPPDVIVNPRMKNYIWLDISYDPPLLKVYSSSLGTWNPAILPPSIVGTTNLINESVTAEKLANFAVTTRSISNNAVTTEKIMSQAITYEKLAPSSVGRDIIANGAVDGNKITNKAVTSLHIQDYTITSNNIAIGGINGTNIAANTINGAYNLADASVTGGKIADRTIHANKLIGKTLTSAEITDGTITTNLLAADVQSAVDRAGKIGLLKFRTGVSGTLPVVLYRTEHFSASPVNWVSSGVHQITFSDSVTAINNTNYIVQITCNEIPGVYAAWGSVDSTSVATNSFKVYTVDHNGNTLDRTDIIVYVTVFFTY